MRLYRLSLVRIVLFTAGLAACLAAELPSLAAANPTLACEEIVIRGETPKNGLFDPSVEYDGHGLLWMAYSVVDMPKRVHTHLAKSADAGRTWEFVAVMNASVDDTIRTSAGESIEGVWRHEVPTLVRDPGDTEKPWKLFWHKYFTQAPYKDRVFQRGWIAMREAASPAGPWSDEVALFGAGGFLLPPHKTRVDLTRLHADLKDCKIFTEPGSLAKDGTIYLSFQAYGRSLFWSDWKIVMLSSSDHGKSWKYVATLLHASHARPFGGDFFTGTSLAEEQGRSFLLVCPEQQAQPMLGHRGTVVFEFGDLAKGQLKADSQGAPVPVKVIRPDLASGGQSDYDEHNTYGGVIMPQFDRANMPRLWRIYNTRTKLGDHQAAPAPLTAAVDDPVARLTCQPGWRAYSGNPCIVFGDHRFLGSWNDPCVLRDGSRYVMYLTTAMLLPGHPPVQPFRAVSDNGTQWRLDPTTPLLASGTASSDFDAQSVETPSVVRLGKQYHLYYTGVRRGLSGSMAIGHAISPDGITWTKDPQNPVVRPTGKPQEFNGLQVAEPGVVVVGDNLYLYFTAVGMRSGGSPPAKRVIALAKSSDGSAFGPPRIVLEQSERYPAELGFDGYSTPSGVYDGHRVHLFYDVGYFSAKAEHKWTQVAIHHAVSPDGVSDWKQDADPIITRRSFPWATMEVRSPTALFEGTTIHLWFAGNNRPQDFLPEVRSQHRTKQFGIGYMTFEGGRPDTNAPRETR